MSQQIPMNIWCWAWNLNQDHSLLVDRCCRYCGNSAVRNPAPFHTWFVIGEQNNRTIHHKQYSFPWEQYSSHRSKRSLKREVRDSYRIISEGLVPKMEGVEMWCYCYILGQKTLSVGCWLGICSHDLSILVFRLTGLWDGMTARLFIHHFSVK